MSNGARVLLVGTSLCGTVLSTTQVSVTVRLDTGRVWTGPTRSFQLI